MAGRLEALVHGNRAVIADVSHQLRTPLAALRLRLDLLAADPDPDPQTTGHELAGALEELARLSRLVDGLLAVARAENVVPVPAAVDVADVARERVVAWHPVADDRGIVLEAGEAGRDAGRAGGDGGREPPVRGRGGWGARSPVLAWMGEGHLEQVLDNLIANALDALSAGGHVTVTTTATTAGARISVADDGPGMSAEDRERAFLRFTTSNPNGTGLGLAIVHRLVTSNGGTAKLPDTGRRADGRHPRIPRRASADQHRAGQYRAGHGHGRRVPFVRAGPRQPLAWRGSAGSFSRGDPSPRTPFGKRRPPEPRVTEALYKAPKTRRAGPRSLSARPGSPS